MNGFEQIIEGIKYSILFFSTFSGHSHPFTPASPIDLDEVYNPRRKAYYLAWYRESEPVTPVKNFKSKLERPKLYFLEKYWIIFQDHSQINDHKSAPGHYFHAITKNTSDFIVESEINASATLSMNEFYMYKIGDNGKIVGSWIVQKGLMDKYSYVYRSNGFLQDVKIEVLDLPKF